MTITLVTGATKGLGKETARRLADAGHVVYVGARDPARGAAVAEEVGGEFVLLDVTNEGSVSAAAEQIGDRHGRLDVLVNNAGISGGFVPARDVTAADMAHVYHTNVFGVVRVTNAFLALLERSGRPVVVNVSSGMGSFGFTTDPDRFEGTLKGLTYPSSKAALNMLTSQYAKSFPQMRINAVDPGHTATDLNGHRGTQTVEEGARAIVAWAQCPQNGPTGGFFDVAGRVPW